MDRATRVADRVAGALLGAGRAAVGDARDGRDCALPLYLEHRLVEHVGAAERWAELGADTPLLDRLSPDAVARVAFLSGASALPAAIQAVVTTHPELRVARVEQRRLVRELAHKRVGDVVTGSETLAWTALRHVIPHLSLTGHTDWVTGVCAVPAPTGHGTWLATTSWDQTVRLWDPDTGTPIGDPLTGHTHSVTGICAVPAPTGHGTWLATTSWDQTVRLWDPATGTPIGDPLTGHTHSVTGICAVPAPTGHGTWLATTSHDRTVRLWDPATGTQTGMALVAPSVPKAVVCVDGLLMVGCTDGIIALRPSVLFGSRTLPAP